MTSHQLFFRPAYTPADLVGPVESFHQAVESPRKSHSQACDYCRKKKVRCNGGNPCTQCLDRSEQCIRNPKRRRTLRRDLSGSNAAVELAQISSRAEDSVPAFLANPSSLEAEPNNQSLQVQLSRRDNGLRSFAVAPAVATSNGNSLCYPITSPEEQEASGICPTELSHSEYHGPRCCFSICSLPAIAWVNDKVKTAGFQESAYRFTKDITRRLKIEQKIPRIRAPEPVMQTAWVYVKAYFDGAQEAAFGVVNRTWFEDRLRTHFSTPEGEEDAAWYTLRNVIYAYGCRIKMSQQASFSVAHQMSWPWFVNALSAFPELVFMRSSLVGVQALVIMAYYTEGLASQILQYMFCSTAVRLACSKGLHRQPAPSWNMSTETVQHRHRIFWAIYCLEKNIAERTGRPLAVEDDEITCHMPGEGLLTQSPENMRYFDLMIRLSQLSAQIGKRLGSGQALCRPPEALVQTISDLESELECLKSSVRPVFDLEISIDPSNPPHGLTLDQALTIQFTYFGLVFSLHSPLAYPWYLSRSELQQDPSFCTRVAKSASTAANAAREAILTTRLVRLDANCSVLLAVYVPIYAVITLFIHVIRDTTLPSARWDLITLDIASGHFARLELETNGHVSMPFAREMARFAWHAVNRTGSNVNGSNGLNGSSVATPADPSFTTWSTSETTLGQSGDDNTLIGVPRDCFDPGFEMNNEFEMWSILLDDLET